MQANTFNLESMMLRIKRAKSNKRLWEHRLRECYKYAMPEKNTIDQFNKGQNKRHGVYDSTAIQALEDYASRMESQLVPAWRKWFKLEAGSEIPEENKKEVEDYLEKATDIIFDHINHSNFNAQVKETFLDLGISTGAIIVEEGDGINTSLNFRSVSLSQVILERSERGIPETVWREIKVTAADIESIWPRAKITSSIKQKIDKDPSCEVTLIEGIALDYKTKKYISMLIYEEEKEVLYDEFVERNPWIVFRESTISGEVYGRGRVMKCIDDIKTLNKMVEDYLLSLEWQANPIFTGVTDSIHNPFTNGIRPGVILPVFSNETSNPTLQALNVGGNPQLLDFAIKTYQDHIRQALMSKPFGNIEESPVRSATEMSIRNSDLQSVQGSASGRLQTELIERLIGSVAKILIDAGKLKPMKIDGKMVTIKFTSPVARQQDADEVMVAMQLMEMFQGLDPAKVEREVKTEDLPGWLIDKMGAPASFKRSEAEKQEFDKKQEAMMQQAMAAQGGNGAV